MIIVSNDLFLLHLINLKVFECIFPFLVLLLFLCIVLSFLLLSKLLLLCVELLKGIQFLGQNFFFILLLPNSLFDRFNLAVIHCLGFSESLLLLQFALVQDRLVENEVEQQFLLQLVHVRLYFL